MKNKFLKPPKTVLRIASLMVVLLLSIQPNSFAADRAISGVVTDGNDGEPLVGATVQVQGQNIGTLTDIRGEYTLSIPDDVKAIMVTYVGYATRHITAGEGGILNVVLDENQYTTGEIIVTTTRADMKLKNIPRKINIITSKDIEALDPLSATDLLKKTAGVDVIEYPGVLSGVSIRGFKPNFGSYSSAQYVRYLLDGRPLGTYNLGAVDMNMIERVEVIKGPSSALYGSQGMGGTVNFISKKSQGPIKGKASLGYGSFETFEGSATVGGSISNRFDYHLGFRYFNQGDDYNVGNNTLISDPSSKLLEDSIETMQNSTYTTNSGSLRLGYRLGEKFRIDLRGAFFNAPSVHSSGSIWGHYGDGLKDVNRATGDFFLTGTVGSHSIKFIPYWSLDESHNFDVSSDKYYVSSETRNEEYGFQLQDAVAIGRHRVTGGLDYNSSTYKTKRRSSPDVEIRPYSPNAKTTNIGFFTETSLSFLDERIIMTPGVRYDMTTFGLLDTPLIGNVDTNKEYDGFFSPSVALQYSFLPVLKTHASVGRAFVSPTGLQKAGEYIDTKGVTVRGNPDLKPETGSTWETGLTYNDEVRGWRADVTYYDTTWDDFITSENRTDGLLNYKTYINAASAKLRGLEFELSYDFGAQDNYRYSLRTFASYTHQLEAAVTINGETSSMKYVREGLGSFGFEYDDFRFLNARLSARYLGSRYEDNYYGANYDRSSTDKVLKHEPSLVFDATVGLSINNQNSVALTVKNILDENYTEKDGYNMPGRSMGVKYTVTF